MPVQTSFLKNKYHILKTLLLHEVRVFPRGIRESIREYQYLLP